MSVLFFCVIIIPFLWMVILENGGCIFPPAKEASSGCVAGPSNQMVAMMWDLYRKAWTGINNKLLWTCEETVLNLMTSLHLYGFI